MGESTHWHILAPAQSDIGTMSSSKWTTFLTSAAVRGAISTSSHLFAEPCSVALGRFDVFLLTSEVDPELLHLKL
jgi:hypothetical protein